MKIPERLKPIPFVLPSDTEPDQAIDLQTIVYRVSMGQTTGLNRIPEDYYGCEDGDDPIYNGITQEVFDALDDYKELKDKEEKLNFKIRGLKRRVKRNNKEAKPEVNQEASDK